MATDNHSIFQKIDEGTVTAEDFNQLISEATPEATRDRVRRRTTKNVTDDHIDDQGHQQLELPKFAARVQPKRERADNTQMHGQGKAAHKRSTRTQRRKAKSSVSENKKFKLSFDKAGYYNNLREMLEERGWKSGKNFIIDTDTNILTITPSVKFDEELKKFLKDVGRVERIDLESPDIFEEEKWYESHSNIKMVMHYLAEEEKWSSQKILEFVDEPWKWEDKYEAAKEW